MALTMPPDTVRRLVDEVRDLRRQREELRAPLVQLEPHLGATRKQLQPMLVVLS